MKLFISPDISSEATHTKTGLTSLIDSITFTFQFECKRMHIINFIPMDYLKIIIEGCSYPVDRINLTDYFDSYFKKKERDSDISANNMFFNYCLNVVKGLKSNIENQYNRRRNELISIRE